MLFIYRITINLILLLSPIIFFLRILKKKEHPIRFTEKLCFFSKKKIRGKLIWFHGASVGEILSVIPIIEKLENDKKIKQILITSNTLSSSKILSTFKLKKTIHQFFPIDTNHHTQKFIDYWDPTIAIFIDSEIWPNMITNIKKKNIPLILLNARITKKSFKRWNKFIFSTKQLFQKFDTCLSSNLESKKFLKILGAKKIKYIGNLKFSQIEKNENFLLNKQKKNFLNKQLWCASSTHDKEEIICANVHKKLKDKYKNLLTIIIPRHVHRTEKIINEIQKLNLKVHTHESTKIMDPDTDIYLVNSYGKTKSFFKICKIVFLGGSMIKHGGQNPLEAVRFGCKILYGPNYWNFYEIYNLLNKYKVSNKVSNIKQLSDKVDSMIGKKNNSKNIRLKINNLGDKILKSTLKEINTFIENK
jgi:3-deoxy-D-manno-octulosonic-acid transferase